MDGHNQQHPLTSAASYNNHNQTTQNGESFTYLLNSVTQPHNSSNLSPTMNQPISPIPNRTQSDSDQIRHTRLIPTFLECPNTDHTTPKAHTLHYQTPNIQLPQYTYQNSPNNQDPEPSNQDHLPMVHNSPQTAASPS